MTNTPDTFRIALEEAAPKSRADAGISMGTDQAAAYETGFELGAQWAVEHLRKQADGEFDEQAAIDFMAEIGPDTWYKTSKETVGVDLARWQHQRDMAKIAAAEERLIQDRKITESIADEKCRAFLARAEKAEAHLSRCREALEFYADKFNWRTNSGKIGITPLTDGSDAETIDGHWTNGKRARAALGGGK